MEAPVQGRLQVAGNIEYRDAEGNIIKVVPFTGSLAADPQPAPAEEPDDGNRSE